MSRPTMIRGLTSYSYLRGINQSKRFLPNTATFTFTRMSTTTKMNHAAQEEFPVAKAITENLRARFSPYHLDVINESYMHNV